ncbi:hypothetical protein CONLIGDRAFT_418324 [Coniochaeta ligniaria NRRL 30616]|uniref:NACHT domain-containing protein n=1 Tax=Coniochaeta ligniaria NRRL 30616 TaxID=1408157 RepID=A0A1J7IIK4_9PEZI|nr:hypothetical protein CONLIGDRAFT_418324 [Coniochaeta ligniaria NRRL 30616]
MEAATAIGLAMNMVQLFQTISSIVSTAREVYNSASGSSRDVEAIKQKYSTLQKLHAELGAADHSGTGTEASYPDKSLMELAATCNEKCSQLVEYAGKLAVTRQGKFKWISVIRVVALTFWFQSDVKNLAREISEVQARIVFRICCLTRTGVDAVLEQLVKTKEYLSAELRCQIEMLHEQLSQVHSAIQGFESQNTGFATRIKELEMLVKEASAASSRYQTITDEHAVLKSLDYDCRATRYDTIHKAHESTFEWIFTSPSGPTTKPHRFLEWLEKGDHLFWIRGKPGAGKSTLMKFISDHPRTKEGLQAWASPSKACIGSHYFWSSGSPLQKSYGGLMRSIVFDIFCQIPALIAPICQGQAWWPDTVDRHHAPIMPKWSEATLTSCLERLATAKDLPVDVKFCFFIDGLDEYDGHVNGEAKDYAAMRQTLSRLAASPRIKICFSSRPSNEFSDRPGDDSLEVLDVQELTAHDIRRYAQDGLANLAWKQLSRNSSTTPTDLMESFVRRIQSQCQGVFLWVFLVVRLLRVGVRNGDSLQQLQQRLNGLPSDLEPFFKRILEAVDPYYHERMAGFLRLALASEIVPLSIHEYIAHDHEYDLSRPLLDEPNCAAARDEDAVQMKPLMDMRLQAITQGLLESDAAGKVHFLHRSVADFLRTEKMMHFLVKKSNKDFTPFIAILRAALAVWKSPALVVLLKLERRREASTLVRLYDAFMGYIRCYGPSAQLEDYSKTWNLLEQLEWALYGVVLAYKSRIWHELDTPSDNKRYRWDVRHALIARKVLEEKGDAAVLSSILFRLALLDGRMVSYLISKVQQQPKYLCGLPWSPLVPLVERAGCTESGECRIKEVLPLIQLLLELGYDPNQESHIGGPLYDTPWAQLVAGLEKYVSCAQGHSMISLFVDSRADPNAFVNCRFRFDGNAPRLLPAWAVIYLSAFDSFKLGTYPVPEEYLDILRSVLSVGPELGGLMQDQLPSIGRGGTCLRPLSGWQFLRLLLDNFRPKTRPDDSSARLETCALYELAKAEEAGGRKIFPWGEIKPKLREIYPAQLLEPLFGIIGSDDST